MIIAREEEKQLLEKYYKSNKAEFVVIKGRRSVGKTFLIKEYFNNNFFFSFTGILGATTETTLNLIAMILNIPKQDLTWFLVFEHLKEKLLKSDASEKKVIFLDEISWLDTKDSDFMQALEYAWNSHFSGISNLLLIVSGSATTWITNNLINNTRGLYRRITGVINLLPFKLFEVKVFFEAKDINYSNLDICEVYAIFGGIPQYLDYFDKTKSVSQNVDEIIFKKNAFLKEEFKTIYTSLFHSSDNYLEIIRALSLKRKGLTQDEIIENTKLSKNGRFSSMLDDLCESGFVRKYYKYPNKTRSSVYQLIDNFSCFASFFEKEIYSDHFLYSRNRNDQRIIIYLGFAFERVCLNHIQQIEQGLKFNQIANTISSYKGKNSQVDLIFERADRIINLVEIKYSDYLFEIDKDYYQKLLNKKSDFCNENNIKKTVNISMITTFGVKTNAYSSIINNQMTLDDLFLKGK